MSKFLASQWQVLTPYTPGEQPQDRAYIKLNTNEAPFAPAPEVIAAVSSSVMENLCLYPDPECGMLRDALASQHGLARGNVFVANGSDDILNFLFKAYAANGGKAYFPDVTYGFYKVFAALHGADWQEVPVRDNFTIDWRDYFGKDGLIVLANPNAPTGAYLAQSDIKRIVGGHPGSIVVVDEAYIDFGGASCVPLVRRYDNLVVVQTFSKSRAMAGARLGVAFAQEALIRDLELFKYVTNPYAINLMTMKAGLAAISAAPYYAAQCRAIARTREETAAQLTDKGFQVLPSMANFLFLSHPAVSGKDLYLKLKAQGILVRHFDAPRTRNHIRVTIGTDKQMAAFIEAAAAIAGGDDV